MKISSNFDSGNIIVLDDSVPSNIRLKIRQDHQSDFFQWFHFRLSGAQGQLCALHIEDVADAAYPDGWTDYQAVASYDRENWFRVSTLYKDDTLTIQHVPESDSIYFAYFAPYSMERHHDLISTCATHDTVRLEILGETVDGQDMDMLVVGEPAANKKVIWIIARQHPGETMAEWLMEGLLYRLLDEDEALSRELLKKAVFYIVPNMNPDGSRRGHLRTNAAGVNLNRAWADPAEDTSPEVFYVRNRMEETGIELMLDVHGDEALPYNFIAAFEGNANPDPEKLQLVDDFQKALMTANPDFQMEHGYPKETPGTATMTVGTNQLAERFEAVAMTLEMPFKDTVDSPHPDTGWSPERSAKLGYSCLDALSAVIDRL